MKVKKSIAARLAGSVSAALVASALVPTAALAEESVSGADLLIPKVGEFVPALLGFLVIWVVLAKFAWPKILANMEAREAKISADFEAAEKAKKQAQEQLSSYEAKLAGAQRDADAIIDEARTTAKKAQERIVEEANKQAGDIVARGRATVESERRAAMVDLTSTIADVSVNAAAKIIDKNLDTEGQRKLVEKYLDEVGGFNAR